MKKEFAHIKAKPEPIAVKAVIASLLDQARDKVSFVGRDDPDGFSDCSAPKEVRAFTEGFVRAAMRWRSTERMAS
ncbi:MAG: hypothetical protein HFE91_11305 [Acutalibacter sp.]|uniref:hypothetical protein n=1 Tax=Acutalibacter sp. TaxID=1918636 RepID=UPI002173E2A5|nr:hypothetical protein [Acutalibacter sp.]MCI9226033.1 hypothetical protein [Acutalibacter sp.]